MAETQIKAKLSSLPSAPLRGLGFTAQPCGRSDLYIDTKQAIVDLIEEYRKGYSGDAKKYACNIKRSVQNLDNSYAQNVEYAIEDCHHWQYNQRALLTFYLRIMI